MKDGLRLHPPPAVDWPSRGFADGENVRCTCEWAHPVDGTIDADWPAELDPYCAVHGEPNGFPLPSAAEQEEP